MHVHDPKGAWRPTPTQSSCLNYCHDNEASKCDNGRRSGPVEEGARSHSTSGATVMFDCNLTHVDSDNTEESLTPPREILKNFLLRALATDLAMVVFPRPGPPTKQNILHVLPH